MPHAKYLKGKLWELRFRCEGVNRRITYTIEGQVITLTTFRKQRQNESREIDRARTALARYRDDFREEVTTNEELAGSQGRTTRNDDRR